MSSNTVLSQVPKSMYNRSSSGNSNILLGLDLNPKNNQLVRGNSLSKNHLPENIRRKINKLNGVNLNAKQKRSIAKGIEADLLKPVIICDGSVKRASGGVLIKGNSRNVWMKKLNVAKRNLNHFRRNYRNILK